jgi:hypothetical protein
MFNLLVHHYSTPSKCTLIEWTTAFFRSRQDAEPLSASLVVDKNDWVSEWVGAEDDQGRFVRWRYLDALI